MFHALGRAYGLNPNRKTPIVQNETAFISTQPFAIFMSIVSGISPYRGNAPVCFLL
jgi:hypothetical protein